MPVAVLLVPASAFGVLCAGTVLAGSLGNVFVASNAMLAGLGGIIAFEFWRDRADRLPSRYVLIVLYAVAALSFLARVVQVMFFDGLRFDEAPQQQMLEIHLLIGILHAVGTGAFALSLAYERGAARLLAELSQQLLSRAELAIDYAVITLGDLMGEGATTCDAASLASANRRVLARGAIKAIEVIKEDGGLRCSTFAAEGYSVEAPDANARPGRHPAILVEKTGEAGDGLVRVIWRQDEGHLLIALMNIDALMFDVYPSALRDHSSASILLTPTIDIARFEGTDLANGAADPAIFSLASERYPVSVRLEVDRSSLASWNLGNQGVATQVGLFLAALVCALSLKILLRRPDPVEELRSAIAAGHIQPYFQPVFDIPTRRITGCEVLARWIRPDGSVTPPDLFIPLAESAGLVGELTQRIVADALAVAIQVVPGRPGFCFAFNVTPQQIAEPGFIDGLEAVIRSRGLEPENVTLELTERHGMIDRALVAEAARKARAIGLKLALDDVGTGHNGLSTMQEIPMDTIKIDKRFIDLVASEQTAGLIVEMLVAVARELGQKTVAEGIETEVQLAKLAELGVDEGQGYLVSRPLPAASFTAFLASQRKVAAAGSRWPMAA